MPAETIPLDQAISNAKKRFDEANDLFEDPPATDLAERAKQRSELLDLMTTLDERIVALEAVRDELAAASVIVDQITDAEAQQIRDALIALDTAIRRTETFQANLAILTAALGAVSTVTSAARSGEPAGAVAGDVSTLSATGAATATERSIRAGRARGAPSVARAGPRAPRYVCRMPHHEDLTETVNEALRDVVQTASDAADTTPGRTRRIVVTCSEAHVNVFEVA